MDDLAPDQREEDRQLQMIHSVLQMMEQMDAGLLDTAVWNREKERIEQDIMVRTDSSRPLKNQMFLLLDKIFSMYSEQEADELAVMQLWMKNKECRMPKKWYQEAVELPFETGTVPAPAFYDAVLYKKYGQYMASCKMGGTHDYPLYRKQEEALKEQVGINPYTYVISKEDLESDAARVRTAGTQDTGKSKENGVCQKMTVKKQIREFLQLLEDLQHKLDHIFSSDVPGVSDMHAGGSGGRPAADLREHAGKDKTGMSEGNTEKLLQILTGCQETAIAFGTLIESVKGEGTDTVGKLEAYCEEIYRIYETVLGDRGKVFCVNCDRLRTLSEEIAEACKREIDLRREVVFLPSRVSEWDAIESVWRAAEEDPDCIAFVIPIPYFTKKSDGSFGDMHYEGDRFPDYVPLTAYNAFDYEGHCPDVMYIQNPYDAYNLAVSVHPFFYSENLKKYTEKLVYLPPFVVNEITTEDQRAIENLKYCCIVPGVVHADRVIVQSEGMRQIYIQILTEAAGEETRKIWEEKILGLGSPKMDRNLECSKADMDLPEEWRSLMQKPDGTFKKVVLYGTSAAALLEHPKAMIQKMGRVFSAFEKKQEEILLLWVPEYAAGIDMKEKYPAVCEEYQRLMRQYQEEGTGILDCSGDMERAAKVCDVCGGGNRSDYR